MAAELTAAADAIEEGLADAEENHDVQTIRDRLGEVPMAGFFAAGEIGPIGDRSFLHGHTLSLALFRAQSA